MTAVHKLSASGAGGNTAGKQHIGLQHCFPPRASRFLTTYLNQPFLLKGSHGQQTQQYACRKCNQRRQPIFRQIEPFKAARHVQKRQRIVPVEIQRRQEH